MDLKFALDIFKTEGALKQIFLGCINCAFVFSILTEPNVFKRYTASIIIGTIVQLFIFIAIGYIELKLNEKQDRINLFGVIGYCLMPLGLLVSFPDYFPQCAVTLPRGVGALIVAWGAVLLTHDSHLLRKCTGS